MQKSRLVHLSGQLGEEKKPMGKREENQMLGYDSKIIHFFKCMKPKRKFYTYPATQEMCEILGLGLGFPAWVGTKKPFI